MHHLLDQVAVPVVEVLAHKGVAVYAFHQASLAVVFVVLAEITRAVGREAPFVVPLPPGAVVLTVPVAAGGHRQAVVAIDNHRSVAPRAGHQPTVDDMRQSAVGVVVIVLIVVAVAVADYRVEVPRALSIVSYFTYIIATLF